MYVRVIEGRVVRGDNPIEYFLSHGIRNSLLSSKGVMAIKTPRMNFWREKNGRRKGVGSSIRRRRGNRGSINIKK